MQKGKLLLKFNNLKRIENIEKNKFGYDLEEILKKRNLVNENIDDWTPNAESSKYDIQKLRFVNLRDMMGRLCDFERFPNSEVSVYEYGTGLAIVEKDIGHMGIDEHYVLPPCKGKYFRDWDRGGVCVRRNKFVGMPEHGAGYAIDLPYKYDGFGRLCSVPLGALWAAEVFSLSDSSEVTEAPKSFKKGHEEALLKLGVQRKNVDEYTKHIYYYED